MRVESRAPARVDLAGGTVDIWPLYLFHPGAQTVNIAIRNYASSTVETRGDRRIDLISHDQQIQESFESLSHLASGQSKLPLLRELVLFFEPRRGITVETSSEVPAGAGLGGSSALNIALCGALARVTGKIYPRAQLLEIAKNVEAIVIRVPTGWQDYFPALYGGASAVHLRCDGVKRERLRVPFSELEEHFVLCYTGLPRDSAINNWEVMKSHIDGDPSVRGNFKQITAIAGRMREALLARDWNDVAELLALEWKNRKRNFKGISTPKIDRMIEATKKHGTLAAKVCGAGGGGCVVFLVKAGTKPAVESELVRLGGQIINFEVSRTGLEIHSGDAKPFWESGRAAPRVSPDQFFLNYGHVRPVWRFFISASLFLFAHLAVGILLGLMFGMFHWEPQPIIFWSSTLILLALLAVSTLLTTLFENKPLASIGLAFRGRWKTDLGIGIALGAAGIFAIAALEWVLGLARFSWNPISGQLVLAGGVYYCALFAIAAAGEEITFRGYPFQRLVESVGPAWAIAILSVAFGLVHLGNPSHTWLSTFNTVFIGIPLAVAYLRTRALWLPLGIHFAWNFFLGFGFGLPVSGIQFSKTLLRADVHGLVQMSGGSYGPEGSWLATGVIALITLCVLFSPGIYITPEMRALAFNAPNQASGNPGQAAPLFDDSSDSTKMMLPGVR